MKPTEEEVKKWFEIDESLTNPIVESLRENKELSSEDVVKAALASIIQQLAIFERTFNITDEHRYGLMWAMISTLTGVRGPMTLIFAEEMLNPASESQFRHTITSATFKWLQDRARAILSEDKTLSEFQKEHLQSILNGKIPFGYGIKDQ